MQTESFIGKSYFSCKHNEMQGCVICKMQIRKDFVTKYSRKQYLFDSNIEYSFSQMLIDLAQDPESRIDRKIKGC